MLLIDSGLSSDMFNILCCEGTSKRESIQDAIHHFGKKGIPFAFWVGFEQDPVWLEEELEKLGLAQVEMEWAMACELDQEWKPPQASILVRQVSDQETLQDFISILCALLPAHEHASIKSFYSQSTHILLNPESALTLFVGYDKEEPISTASVYMHSGLASIFDIIVLPQMRGRGIGKQMTLQAMRYAKEKGMITAILTATNDARYLYEKLGFKVVKEMKVFGEKHS
jgi:predicted GNAT family acetyltransferase